MDQRRSTSTSDTDRREPIRSLWLWVTLVVVILAGVPFYLPTGSTQPLIAGVPYWLVISFAATLTFSSITCWACLRGWNLAEPEEEADAEGRRT